VRLRKLESETPGVRLYLKLEFMNPGGSVKDRPALQMIRDALADGRLTKDKTLIDSTSGNTGVAYSLYGAAFGVKVALVMPSNVSAARKNITQAFGTRLIYSDPMEGSDGAILHCKRLVEANPDAYFYPDQYSNPSNPLAHYLGTGREILEQVGGEITHFVAGLGTSGTMMGTTRRLREHSRKVTCVAVQPDEPFHGLEGLKHMASSIIPPIYDANLPDEHMGISTEEGWEMSEKLAELEGLYVGHSAGANVAAAVRVAKRIKEGCVVTIACDRGDRYFVPLKWEKQYEW
jgi:cysteine synthase B